jgi:uncharacterized protein
MANSRRLAAHARALLHGLDREPTVFLCGVSAVLILSHYHGSGSAFRRMFGAALAAHPARGALPYFWWYGTSVVLYLFVPLLLSRVTSRVTGRAAPRGLGLGLGDWRAGVPLCGVLLAVMLPVVWVAARTPTFADHYPLARAAAYTLGEGVEARRSLGLFLAYEAAYVAYFVAWEFLFRGWLLNGLLPHFGRAGSILAQTVPFALMHLGKPELEALGAILAGMALGVLALRTRSFWYGAVLHAAVAVSMDVLAAFPYLFGP